LVKQFHPIFHGLIGEENIHNALILFLFLSFLLISFIFILSFSLYFLFFPSSLSSLSSSSFVLPPLPSTHTAGLPYLVLLSPAAALPRAPTAGLTCLGLPQPALPTTRAASRSRLRPPPPGLPPRP
jgi:hypothetical protein